MSPYTVTTKRPCPDCFGGISKEPDPALVADPEVPRAMTWKPCETCHDPKVGPTGNVVTRRAVATLEESSAVDLSQPVVPCEYLGARVMAYALVLQAAQRSKSWLYEDFEPHFKAALALTESGGTVGPLPDGTVIGVEPRSTDSLIAELAALGVTHGPSGDVDLAVIAAFNAKQSA